MCYGCHREREIESRADHAMQALCDDCAARPHTRPSVAPQEMETRKAPARRVVALATARAFPARPLRWLYQPYLPLGKVSILAGPPGQGKSQLALWLASAVTRGELYGDVTGPADVVIVSAEDDPHDTIIPRLIAVNADFDHVFILNVRERETDGTLLDAALALPSDGPRLQTALEGRNIRFIVLDPVSAFLDAAVDSYKNASVRRALQPLKTVAEAVGASIIAITHLTKGFQANEPLDRVIDSVAFTALARSVMLMSADPDDEQGTRGSTKVMLLAKANLAPPGEHAQRFELQTLAVPTDAGPVSTSRIAQVGAAPDLRSHDLLMPPDERSELSNAIDFLRRELRDGWRSSDDIRKAGHTLGVSDRTLKRARQVVCGRAQKERGEKARWWIGLRGTLPPWEGGQSARAGSLGTLGTLGEWGPTGPTQEGQEFQESAPMQGGPLDDENAALRERDRRLGERWEDENDH